MEKEGFRPGMKEYTVRHRQQLFIISMGASLFPPLITFHLFCPVFMGTGENLNSEPRPLHFTGAAAEFCSL